MLFPSSFPETHASAMVLKCCKTCTKSHRAEQAGLDPEQEKWKKCVISWFPSSTRTVLSKSSPHASPSECLLGYSHWLGNGQGSGLPLM